MIRGSNLLIMPIILKKAKNKLPNNKNIQSFLIKFPELAFLVMIA